ncbi:MarR family winged helix-turn-helix transcriptional regulator [Actinomycetospora straminea]|uniref:MarR family winged helix-turn-helix transcriptional regulator n=1 Tax=Actinomycetospora straminea TaxID=663607 RepID=UPI002365CBFD|nr:MarR family transcriptional regulator [Actinomycetospora straminea]MDD7933241.1 MarR family transcriptional regulator [Actinomycetospora straminea]
MTEGSGPADVPDRMRDLVLAVDAYRRAYADVLGLGVGEVLTIADLGREGARPVAILATRLGVTAPAGTALVDRLQTKGLVVRRPHPSDRRSVLVDLTPRGRRVADLMGRLFREDVQAALDGAPVEHLRELADLLDGLAAVLRHRAGDVNRLRRRLLRADTAIDDVPGDASGVPDDAGPGVGTS